MSSCFIKSASVIINASNIAMHFHSLVRSLSIAWLAVLNSNTGTPLRPVVALVPQNSTPLRKHPIDHSFGDATTSRRAFLYTTAVCTSSFVWTDPVNAAPPKAPDSDPVSAAPPKAPDSELDSKGQEKKRKFAEKEAARLAAETKKRLAVGRIGTI